MCYKRITIQENKMERRLNKKIESYTSEFKDRIREKAVDLGFMETDMGNKLLQFVFDYDRLTLEKDDFTKRKRVKNMVSFFDRCYAKRANATSSPSQQFASCH